MAIRLTESKLRQIIRQEINEMARMAVDPMGNQIAVGNSAGRPRTRFDKIVRNAMPYYNPENPSWPDEIPMGVMYEIGNALGGPYLRNWDKVVDAFMAAGLSKEDAGKFASQGSNALYSPWELKKKR